MRVPSLIVLFALLLTGCANNSLLTPYPVRAGVYTHALGTGMLEPALTETRRIASGRDVLLARLEEGRLAQLQGDAEASRRAFGEADRLIRQAEGKAVISAGASAQQGLSLLSNDNVITYQCPEYEQVFLHTYQALNYLAAGDREGAQVEMRQAHRLQDRAADRLGEDNPPRELPPGAAEHYGERMANLGELAGRSVSSVQNAWTLYLAGLLYEAAGLHDDAWIDYKRALGLTPGHAVLQKDLARLAGRLNRRADADALKLPAPPKALKPAEGEVVVLFEEGTAPPRQELFLPFPWPEAWYVLAIPYYPQAWQPPAPLTVESPLLKQAARTEPLADIQALSARALRDRMPALLLRQTLRAQAKHKLQQEGRGQGGEVLGMLIGAWNLVSEQADLRSWLTLPRFAHVARFPLPEGEHELRLDNTHPVRLTVRRQRPTLLRVVRVDNRFYTAAWPL